METINQALAEVSDIILHSDYEIIRKIPVKFIKFIEENKDSKYNVNIDYAISINEQNLLPETREILAVVYRDYLCDEDERQEIIEKSKKYEEALREKYDSSNLFKNNIKENTANTKCEEKKIVLYKESIISRCLNLIRKILKL